nr:hypothetical protein BaRGS_006487 [Batillaria attramentaria]
MQRQPFSLATDGSNEKEKKYNPIVITIAGSDGLIAPELLALPGKNIFDIMARELKVHNIPWGNCVAFACDNANVMTGRHSGVYSFVAAENSQVHLANCCLHLVHIAAKKGAEVLPAFSDVLVDVFFYFQKSANRQQELENLKDLYDIKAGKVLKHVCTRWLSIGRCLQRLIALWQPLQHFFRDEKEKENKKTGAQSKKAEVQTKKAEAQTKKTEVQSRKSVSSGEHSKAQSKTSEVQGSSSSSYSRTKVANVYDFLKSPTNLLYGHFLVYTLKVFDPVLLQLQAEQPMIHKLRDYLCQLIRDIYARFCLPSSLQGKEVDQVQYKDRGQQKADEDLLIGMEAKKMLLNAKEHHLRDCRVKDFYADVRLYFETVVEYLLKKLPLENSVLKNAIVIDPHRQMEVRISQLEYFLLQFPVLLPKDVPMDEILEQFSRYQAADIKPILDEAKQEEDKQSESSWKKAQDVRVDALWNMIISSFPDLLDLARVMKGIMTIPHSSAPCERVFSKVKKNVTDQRSCLSQETTEALLVLKSQPRGVVAGNFEIKDSELQALKSAYRLSKGT